MNKKIIAFLLLLGLLVSNTARAQFVSQEAEMQARGDLFAEEPQQLEPKPAPLPQPISNFKYDTNVKIAFIVNGEMISTDDINNRVKAFSFTTKIPVNNETKEMIFSKIRQSTIDEKIKIQEAQKENITISESEIDDAVASFAANNKMTRKEFENDLRKNGVNVNTIREQLKSDLAWIRLVKSKSYGETEVNQRDIERAIADAQKDSSKKKYRLSEIVVSKKNNRNINELVSTLRQDPRFELYAMQFSEAPTASNGGNLGWIDREKLFPVTRQPTCHLSKVRHGCEVPKEMMSPMRSSTPGATVIKAC